jgi:hypothetical protein
MLAQLGRFPTTPISSASELIPSGGSHVHGKARFDLHDLR